MKAMYNTIVVAFDGSEYSRAAVIEASNLIKRHGGKVVMVHAVYFDEEEFGIAPEQRDKRFEFGKKICYQTKDILLSEFDINVESLVCEGDPADVIVDIAQEKKADLIAMGTHGRKGLKRLIMGSVTSGVIVNAPCDVLVVKKPCTECTGGYKSVLVPFDGSEFSKKALLHACEIAKIDDAEVTVLYSIPRYEEMVGFMKTGGIHNSLELEARKVIDKAKEVALAQGVSIKPAIEEGNAADKTVELAKKLGSDLIVMGSYGWRGINKAIMGSTTERVIMDSPCPILAVR